MTLLKLAWHLHSFVKQHGSGYVVRFAPLDLVLSDTNVVQLDYLIVSNQRQHIITPDSIRGHRAWWWRYCSPSTASRDWRIKLDLYAEYRAQEYWWWTPMHSESG